MLSDTTTGSNVQREWKVEFSGGRLVNVTGETANCEREACGEYFAINGFKVEDLEGGGSFATLGIKKNISKINSHGYGTPEIKGEGVVNILFCGTVQKGLNSTDIKDSDWSSRVCLDGWKIVRDGRKNGKKTGTGGRGVRNGLGWYVIGFIWDNDTQYFGFINEENLFSKVLKEELVKDGITIDKGDPKRTELFAGTFTGLLNTPVGDVSCLHLSSRDSQIRGTCSSWTTWAGTISMPMGSNGKDNMTSKKLSEAALVIVPVNQIRVKDGKLKGNGRLSFLVVD